jgi:putative ABC transport system substrate-binding protein
MKRREFIAIVGGAAACWPLAAHARQVDWARDWIFESERPPAIDAEFFRSGLRDLGYIDGQNVRIEYRWAEGIFARLPSGATEARRPTADEAGPPHLALKPARAHRHRRGRGARRV